MSKYNKALVAALLSAATAAAPAVIDALNAWVAGVVGVAVTTLGVYAARNKPAY